MGPPTNSNSCETMIAQPIQPYKTNEASTLRQYYTSKIQEAKQQLTEKMQNVRRLQAQRNEMNNKVFGKKYFLIL